MSGELGNNQAIADNSFHVVNASDVGSSTILDGFTIRAGNADGSFDDAQGLGFGGGIFSQSSQATLRNLVLEANNAAAGGGLFVGETSFHLVENVDFRANATTGDGGAVYNQGQVTFLGSDFTSNNAADNGGAVYNARGELYLAGSVFNTNQSEGNGGAVYLLGSSAEVARQKIVNSSFFSNQSNNGGAIYNDDSDAEGFNLTFANNQATRGAAVYSRGSDEAIAPEYTNSIFWGNLGTADSAQIFNDNEETIVRNSIVEGGFAGQGILNENPLFINQADGDLRVAQDSVAVNAGSNEFVIEERDLSDRVRIFDGTVDLGAYEYSETYLTINDPTIEIAATEGEPSQAAEVTFNLNLVDSLDIAAPQDSAITVTYQTVAGSAVPGEDFVSTSGSITFEPGQTSQTVTVPILSNRSGENTENFSLAISEVGEPILDFDSQGTATIIGEDFADNGSGNDNSGNDGSGNNNSGNNGSNNTNPQTIQLFRFRNTSFSSGTYIFVGAAERDAILSNPDFNQTFSLDGVREDGGVNPAFTASTTPGEDLIPFFRLRSLDVPGTFLFVSTGEYNGIFAEGSDQRDKWVTEGLDGAGNDIPEFYLLDGSASSGAEFSRFQNTQNGTFLYAGSAEADAIAANPNLSSLFTSQGVAFRSLV